MKFKIINQFYKVIIFAPLLIYCGKRSYIAYDEGFYALQARWILQTDNWIIPFWLDQYVLDRTIGIQFLIAKFQQLFGETSFVAHLPTTLAAGLMLILTYKLHQELISKNNAIFSSLILGTTYIWLDFAHLATQDMIFACLVTLGIYSLSKLIKKENSIYLFVFGSWIGLAFMMKTFLIGVPLITLFPYMFYKRQIINHNVFWFGVIIGFLPFVIWSFSINQYLDKNIIYFLLDKYNNLSSKNSFTNPYYYYLWNIPLNFLPWSLPSIFGIIYQFKRNNKVSYLLVYFPIFFIIILSLFSTKTPYYPLSISSILSINAYIGLREILKSHKLKSLLIKITSNIIPIIFFIAITIYFLAIRVSINLYLKEELFLILGLSLASLILLSIKKLKSSKSLLVSLIVTPYLLGLCVVQSGLLTDRSRNLRETLEYTFSKGNLINSPTYITSVNTGDNNSTAKFIKILLLTPNLKYGIKDLKDLKSSELAWIQEFESLDLNQEQYEIIANNKIFSPWKLIKKRNKK